MKARLGRLVPLLLLATLAAPVMASSLQFTGYESLDATGHVAAHGDGLVLQLTGGDPAAPRPFVLAAASARIEVDAVEQDPATPVAIQDAAATTEVYHGATTLRSLLPKSTYQAFVSTQSPWALEARAITWQPDGPRLLREASVPTAEPCLAGP